MAYLMTWGEPENKKYRRGLSHGVHYPKGTTGTYTNGEAWEGLVTVNQTPSGAEPTKIFADNQVYVTLISQEEFSATVEAFTYPDSMADCDGTAEIAPGARIGQQPRKPFGMAYRSIEGNEAMMDEYGYILHLIWGCLAAPTEKSAGTTNDSTDLSPFSWTLSTTPVRVTGMAPTASMDIHSTGTTPEKMAAIEQILYGTPADGENPEVPARLPLPDEIKAILETP